MITSYLIVAFAVAVASVWVLCISLWVEPEIQRGSWNDGCKADAGHGKTAKSRSGHRMDSSVGHAVGAH